MKTAATDYLQITEAKYVSGYKLLISFSDGAVRLVDFGPFLAKARNPDTTDFRELSRFKNFRIDAGDLVWGDYQMIFPIMDLYRGEVMQGQSEESGQYALREDSGHAIQASGKRTAATTYSKQKKSRGNRREASSPLRQRAR